MDYGGYILTKDESVVAAAVVEINHERYFEEGSTDNHFCAISHYHSPCGSDLDSLFKLMHQDLVE